MSEKPEALQAAESLEQAIQFYSAGLENSDNHMTLLDSLFALTFAAGFIVGAIVGAAINHYMGVFNDDDAG